MSSSTPATTTLEGPNNPFTTENVKKGSKEVAKVTLIVLMVLAGIGVLASAGTASIGLLNLGHYIVPGLNWPFSILIFTFGGGLVGSLFIGCIAGLGIAYLKIQ